MHAGDEAALQDLKVGAWMDIYLSTYLSIDLWQAKLQFCIVHVHVQIHVDIHIHVHVDTYTYACRYRYTYTYTFTHTYTYTYRYTCTYRYILGLPRARYRASQPLAGAARGLWVLEGPTRLPGWLSQVSGP